MKTFLIEETGCYKINKVCKTEDIEQALDEFYKLFEEIPDFMELEVYDFKTTEVGE